ncbi:MAG: ABC transporter substrate-binding protein [Acidimicrobiales bacterium]
MKIRFVALICILGLMATACGARLSPAQRAVALSTSRAGGSGSAGGLSLGTGSGATPGSAGSAGSAGTPGSSGTSLGSPGGGSAPGAVPGSPGGSVSGPTPAGGSTSALPPGGNGGATDVGVTANSITIANVSDISGPSPGLFTSAQQGEAAAVAYINSQGGIYGRKVILKSRDDQEDTGQNRTQVLASCQDSFAMVGNTSAFDNGGASAIDACGIPNIAAIATTNASAQSADTYPAYPTNPNVFVIGPAKHIAAAYPNAVKHAALIWIDQATTSYLAQKELAAYSSVGFNFVYKTSVSVVETNFTQYVIAMKNAGVQYITTQSDAPTIVRLSLAMQQQNYEPQVRDFYSVAYDPAFIAQGQQAVEGDLVFVNTALFSEASSSPGMQLYLSWLKRVDPGAVPTYFGIYAFSAGLLFQKAATMAGPKLTRKGVLAALAGIHSWSADGLHAPHDVGNKTPSPCFVYMKIQGGQFVRNYPASGFDCSGGLYHG